MTTMVKLGIGFQKLLTRQGVELDEKMSILLFDSATRWI